MRAVVAILICTTAAACAKREAETFDTTIVVSETTKAPSTAATPAAPAASTDTSHVVTPSGYGAVRIGASVAELSAAVGTKIPPSRTPDERGCRYVALASLPSGMRVMLVNDSVARVDVTASGPKTNEGTGIGDSETQLTSAYGARASVRPNKYTGPVGHDVIVNAPGDSTHRLVFETDGKKILRFRAGRQPAIDLVEGCG